MNNATSNPAKVTWTVGGIKHDAVKHLTNGSEQVVCYDTCCCKRVAS
jgi:hypothetical protein